MMRALAVVLLQDNFGYIREDKVPGMEPGSAPGCMLSCLLLVRRPANLRVYARGYDVHRDDEVANISFFPGVSVM